MGEIFDREFEDFMSYMLTHPEEDTLSDQYERSHDNCKIELSDEELQLAASYEQELDEHKQFEPTGSKNNIIATSKKIGVNTPIEIISDDIINGKWIWVEDSFPNGAPRFMIFCFRCRNKHFGFSSKPKSWECSTCKTKEQSTENAERVRVIREAQDTLKRLDDEIDFPVDRDISILFEHIDGVKNELPYQYALRHGKTSNVVDGQYKATFNFNQPNEVAVFCKLLDHHSRQKINVFSDIYKSSEDLRDYIKEYVPFLHIDMIYGHTWSMIYYVHDIFDIFKERRYECYAFVKQLRDKAKSDLAAEGVAVNKWSSERTLFALLHKYYNDAVYQYKTEWLQDLSLDMYVPSKRFAIEYQGKQHYEPVELFGGEPAFAQQIKRDDRKAVLCKENMVKIIYWPYYQAISDDILLDKLREHDVLA